MRKTCGRWCVVVAVGTVLLWPSSSVFAADPLYQALRGNNLVSIDALVHSSAEANAPGEFGNTPLMSAAAAGSVDAMKRLIAKAADVNAQNGLGTTALMMSVTQIEKVKLLLDAGANANLASKPGHTALFLAAMSDPSAEN